MGLTRNSVLNNAPIRVKFIVWEMLKEDDIFWLA